MGEPTRAVKAGSEPRILSPAVHSRANLFNPLNAAAL